MVPRRESWFSTLEGQFSFCFHQSPSSSNLCHENMKVFIVKKLLLAMFLYHKIMKDDCLKKQAHIRPSSFLGHRLKFKCG